MEFNMARLVTRVTSKNFCIVNPSFELSLATDTSAEPMIQVAEGQACINGMDIIAKQSIRIYHPDTAGDYYLALHLWRDSSNNVLGDLVVGAKVEFHGVYLDWFTTKDTIDPDILYLGKVTWDGTEFTSVQEDLDKYGRIWAEDILCKIEDWKHPNESRMLLQDWMYKAPDWYVSKEGDVIFGALEFLAGRDPNVAGTLADHQDVGTGKYGARLEAVSSTSAKFTFKAPDTADTDKDKVIYLNATTSGITGRIGTADIQCSSSAYNWVLTARNKLELYGIGGIVLGASSSKTDCKVTIDDDAVEISDGDCTAGTEKTAFSENYIYKQIGTGVTLKNDKTDFTITNTNGDINLIPKTSTGKVNITAAELNVSGDVKAGRVFNAVYNDVAEYMEKADYAEDIQSGDVVVFTADGKVTKAINSTGPNCVYRLAGIVSSPDTMGYVLGGEGLADNEKVPVALTGRVYLNVGELSVQAGDLIALTNNGKLEIVSEYTRAVIGKATKSAEDGKAWVLVK